MLGLWRCVGFSPVVPSGGSSVAAVCRLLRQWLPQLRSRALGCSGVSSCSSHALEHRLNNCLSGLAALQHMWDLPDPGIEPVSLHWQANSLPLSHQGGPAYIFKKYFAFAAPNQLLSSSCWLLFSYSNINRLSYYSRFLNAILPGSIHWYISINFYLFSAFCLYPFLDLVFC